MPLMGKTLERVIAPYQAVNSMYACATPGMVVTQHSGTGKADQYFLRGFNLDHGTDFSTRVDGVPVNLLSCTRVL